MPDPEMPKAAFGFLGGPQRRLVKRAELPPIFHLQSRFRAKAAMATTNEMDDVRRS